ncbi:MAG: N-acetylmuramoyl-L-alanine amidase [Ruminococcus sp.]|nr:N-acetylmuramoyl-L-alanine amidase [Ruminococcus sp.]
MGKICFIVGHGESKSGGYDPGAVSGGFHEFKIAREIVRYATEYYNKTYTEAAEPMNYNGNLYLTERIKAVNADSYDFVAEVHLNAGGGTGTECFYHIGSSEGKRYAEAITKAIAAAFGVKNRGAKTKANSSGKDYFAIIRETKPTAVLIETLFIDSSDLKHLDETAEQKKCGEAIAKAVAEVRGAKKKAVTDATATTEPGKLYRVQVGAFGKRENAEAMMQKLKAAGFGDTIIKES